MTEPADGRRSGTVALVGRPNAGKSTLMNRWLGQKLAIVSDKPQTTRHRLIGILTEDRGQMVFFDTPGVHRPLHRLNQRMVQHAVEALNEADVVCLLVDAAERFGSGDAYMLDLIRRARVPRLLALNKVDRVSKPRLLPEIRRYADSGLFEEVVPISAETGDGCDALLDQLWPRLAVGEPRYDPALLTTQPERYHVAERIREQILRQTRDELPFTTAVVIDLWEEDAAAGRLRILASILVETPGQKKILIGKGGERVREIGTRARGDLQEFLGRKLHLELHVRHEPKWRDDRHLLARLERDLEGDLGAG